MKRKKRARDYFELEPGERILRERKAFLEGPILLTNKQIYYRKGLLFTRPCKVPYKGIRGISADHWEPYNSPFPLDEWNMHLYENSGIYDTDSSVEMEFKDELVKNVLEARMASLVPKKDFGFCEKIGETGLSDEIVKELHGDNLADLTGPGYYCGCKKRGQIMFVYTANWIAGVSTKGDVAIPHSEVLLYELERDIRTTSSSGSSEDHLSGRVDEVGNKLTIYTKNGGIHEFVNLCDNSGRFFNSKGLYGGDTYSTESLMKNLYKTNGRPDRIKCKGLNRIN